MERVFRTVEVAQILGTLVAAVAAVISGVEQRLIKKLTRAAASTPGNAIPLESKYSIVHWRLSRLVAQGVIRTTDDGRFFYDRETQRRRRLRRLKIAIPAMLLAITFGVALHWWLG